MIVHYFRVDFLSIFTENKHHCGSKETFSDPNGKIDHPVKEVLIKFCLAWMICLLVETYLKYKTWKGLER